MDEIDQKLWSKPRPGNEALEWDRPLQLDNLQTEQKFDIMLCF